MHYFGGCPGHIPRFDFQRHFRGGVLAIQRHQLPHHLFYAARKRFGGARGNVYGKRIEFIAVRLRRYGALRAGQGGGQKRGIVHRLAHRGERLGAVLGYF